jgi:hypothetical protein
MVLLAGDLRDELAPKGDGEKTILLKMIPGQRPEVTFTGLWTGKYIAAATNSIAKAYRVGRRNITRPRVDTRTTTTPQNAEVKKEA